MNITDELERLNKLHKEGALSDEEFAQAKTKLLSQQETPAPVERGPTLGDAANRYVSFQMVMGVVAVILFLILLFGVFLPAMQRTRAPTIQFQPSK